MPGLPTTDWESLAVQRLAYVATVAIALSLAGYGLSSLRGENVGWPPRRHRAACSADARLHSDVCADPLGSPQPPLAGLVFSGDSMDGLIHAHCFEAPGFPEPHGSADFPVEFGTLVLACLAKEPSRRPSGFDAIAKALRALAVELPWTSDEARAWWIRHQPSPKPGAGTGEGVANTRTWHAGGDTAPTLHA